MRRRSFLGLILALLLLCSGVASAQGGRRGGGMFGRMGGLQLLRLPPVQQELKMTPEQIGKIRTKQQEVRQALQGGGNPGQLSAEERRARMARMQEIQSKAIAAILDPAQQKRLRQIELQQQGPLAIAARQDIAAELKLTEAQQRQAADVQRQANEEMRAALRGVDFQSLSGDERAKLMGRMRQAQQTAGDKVTALLTDAQKAQWKEMQGAPFVLPPPGRASGGARPPVAPPTSGSTPPGANAERAEIGKPVRDFRLRDLSSDTKTYHTLSQYRGKKAVVAVFISNRCGTTWKYEKRMGKLLRDIAGKDVVLLGVHSNANETQDEIRKYVEARNFGAPVLDDKEKNEFVTYFDARATPTVLVIDKQGVLRYKGAYDDNDDEAQVKARYAEDALNAVLTGKEVPVTTTRAFG